MTVSPGSASAPWHAMAASPFVSLGTDKHNGDLVSVPVWIAPDGADLVVTSVRTTGKVKRGRRDPRFERLVRRLQRRDPQRVYEARTLLTRDGVADAGGFRSWAPWGR